MDQYAMLMPLSSKLSNHEPRIIARLGAAKHCDAPYNANIITSKPKTGELTREKINMNREPNKLIERKTEGLIGAFFMTSTLKPWPTVRTIINTPSRIPKYWGSIPVLNLRQANDFRQQ
jgi:hypothetical protein